MRVFITGSTGFIGKNLVKALLEEGNEVICLVRKDSDTNYLEALKVKLVYGDLLNKDSFQLPDNVDVIYHLGGLVYSRNIEKLRKVNYEGSLNLFNKCIQGQIKKFIFLSSLAAVGPAPKGVELNEWSVCHPITPYGKSKYIAEKEILEKAKEKNFLTVVILRAPLVYGENMSKRSRLYKVLKLAKKGVIIQIGDATNKIPLCHVDNLINILKSTSRNDAKGVYFIRDKRNYMIDDITDSLKVALKRKIKKIYLSQKIKPILKIFPNINKDLIDELGYNWGINIDKLKRDFNWIPDKEFKNTVPLLLKNFNLL